MFKTSNLSFFFMVLLLNSFFFLHFPYKRNLNDLKFFSTISAVSIFGFFSNFGQKIERIESL